MSKVVTRLRFHNENERKKCEDSYLIQQLQQPIVGMNFVSKMDNDEWIEKKKKKRKKKKKGIKSAENRFSIFTLIYTSSSMREWKDELNSGE